MMKKRIPSFNDWAIKKMEEFRKEETNESAMNELADMENLPYEELLKHQQNYGPVNPSCDIIFGGDTGDTFKYMKVQLKDIDAPKGLSLRYYKKAGLDEDEAIVERLIDAYKKSPKKVPAIVIDERMKIMDGLHRYVAMKEVYKRTDVVYVFRKN